MTENTTTHHHYFNAEIGDMWCEECNTVTDFCQQINPFDSTEEE